jgi:cytoskeletal protein RodZ
MIEFANEGEMLTVGKLLRNERERQELSLEDISDRTKINAKYLQAIEEDRKDGFPGDLYCDLFTKSYAEALGLEYARIMAGTFSPSDKPQEGEKRSRSPFAKSAAETKKPVPDRIRSDKKSDAVDPKPIAESGSISGSSVKSSVESSESESDETNGSGKNDVGRYLIVVAAVVFCLLIIVIYISISSEKPGVDDAGTRESVPVESAPTHQALDEQANITKQENSQLDATGTSVIDSGADGPVMIYPDSLEVMFVSTEESWASVVADGDTVFTSFFKAGDENLFRAERELNVALGRWEFISGFVYGHPMKEIASFHKSGWNSVKLNITKDNWEAFIDSSKLDNEQD